MSARTALAGTLAPALLRTTFVSTFGLTVVMLLIVCSLVGRFLPEPFASLFPPHGMMRTEMIWSHAVTGPACAVLIGDSRIAFNVNGASLSTPSCEVRNYGFAGLGPEVFLAFISELSNAGYRPKLAVVTFGDTQFLGVFHPRTPEIVPPKTPRLPEPDLRALVDGFMKNDLLFWPKARHVLLSYFRVTRYLESLLGVKPLPSGWTWDERNGRWSWDSVEERRFVDLPSRDRETHAMALNYYDGKSYAPNLRQELAQTVGRFQTLADRIVLLIPPSLPSFAEEGERTAPGVQQEFRDAVARTAAEAGVPLIDCTDPKVCGIDDEGFADPVHLNAEGAAQFTQGLRSRLSPLLPKSEP